jgi:integrase/recombinase XerD
MTELARAGVHPRIIQQRAGHSSLATTQRYVEVTPDQERKAVRAIRL